MEPDILFKAERIEWVIITTLYLCLRNNRVKATKSIQNNQMGLTRFCGTQGKKQNGTPLIFLLTYFCQKFDTLKTWMVKNYEGKKKDCTFHIHTRFNAPRPITNFICFGYAKWLILEGLFFILGTILHPPWKWCLGQVPPFAPPPVMLLPKS